MPVIPGGNSANVTGVALDLLLLAVGAGEPGFNQCRQPEGDTGCITAPSAKVRCITQTLEQNYAKVLQMVIRYTLNTQCSGKESSSSC